VLVLLATALTKGKGGVFFVATRLLKYYFLMQLIASVLALIANGVASPLVISDICRFLVLISLLVFLDFDQDLRTTRDRARDTRRAALKSTEKSRLYT
jgi:hypothetical protein